MSLSPLAPSDNNCFVKGMREFKQCVEREKIIFNVEVKDPQAPVDFFLNGEPIVPDGERVEVVNLGDGKHQLIINKAEMGDQESSEFCPLILRTVAQLFTLHATKR